MGSTFSRLAWNTTARKIEKKKNIAGRKAAVMTLV